MGVRHTAHSLKAHRAKLEETKRLRTLVGELEQRDVQKELAITELELGDIEKELAITELELAVLGLQQMQAQAPDAVQE